MSADGLPKFNWLHHIIKKKWCSKYQSTEVGKYDFDLNVICHHTIAAYCLVSDQQPEKEKKNSEIELGFFV